jgi:hypothetical protein
LKPSVDQSGSKMNTYEALEDSLQYVDSTLGGLKSYGVQLTEDEVYHLLSLTLSIHAKLESLKHK